MSEKRRGNFISLWTKISNNSTEFLTISREIVGYLVQLPHKIQNIKNIKSNGKNNKSYKLVILLILNVM